MNLAIQGIDSSQVKWNTEGSFLNDAHRSLKADYIIANPPFNVSDRRDEILLINAHNLGSLVEPPHPRAERRRHPAHCQHLPPVA